MSHIVKLKYKSYVCKSVVHNNQYACIVFINRILLGIAVSINIRVKFMEQLPYVYVRFHIFHTSSCLERAWICTANSSLVSILWTKITSIFVSFLVVRFLRPMTGEPEKRQRCLKTGKVTRLIAVTKHPAPYAVTVHGISLIRGH